MQNVSSATLMALSLLIVSGILVTEAKAQSLTSAPQPSPEIESLTKALTGEWSLRSLSPARRHRMAWPTAEKRPGEQDQEGSRC